MDFSFSDEQNLLRNSVAKYLSDAYSFENWRQFTQSDAGRDPKHWAQFAELGLLAATMSEEQGGLGGGPIETMVIMEEFGKALVVEPFVPTVVIAGGLLTRHGSKVLQDEFLPRIASGDCIIALALAETQSRYSLSDIGLTATRQGADYILNGAKCAVLAAPWADHLLVIARTSGDRRDTSGISLFLVDRNSTGISRHDYPTVDGQRASDINFENVAISASRLIGDPDQALPMLERALDEAIAAHAAQIVGAMKILVDATAAYAKTRQQFGVPIGKFQALQHRMVDMFVYYEQAMSMVLMLTLKLGEDAQARKRAASALKVYLAKAARFVGQEAIQIHGGIGMTEELNVGHYFEQLTMLSLLYGDSDHHMRRYIQLDQNLL